MFLPRITEDVRGRSLTIYTPVLFGFFFRWLLLLLLFECRSGELSASVACSLVLLFVVAVCCYDLTFRTVRQRECCVCLWSTGVCLRASISWLCFAGVFFWDHFWGGVHCLMSGGELRPGEGTCPPMRAGWGNGAREDVTLFGCCMFVV